MQTAKAIMDKAHAQKSDPYLGLLEYRNTPVDGFKSPAQLLMSRNLRSILPTTEKQLQPELACHNAVQGRRELCQKQQKQYYDRNTRPRPALPAGATVRFQHPTGTWQPATVIGSAGTQHSYNIVTNEGHTLRRNRRHLLQTTTNVTSHEVATEGQHVEPQTTETLQQTVASSPIIPPQHTTRSGRMVRPKAILDL